VAIGFVEFLGTKSTAHLYQVPVEQKFNEKAKKGIDHQTRFGDVVQDRGDVHAVRTKRLGKDVVRFIFRYRPLEVLRAQGIAPQADSFPSTSLSQRRRTRKRDSPPEDVKPRNNEVIVLSDSENEDLARIHKKVKREKTKREPLEIQSAGVIDLT